MRTGTLAVKWILVLLLAAWFIFAPIDSLVGKGPFGWHIGQPEAWQGGAEVLALIALFFGALSLPQKRIGTGLVLLFGWLYARRHGVDLSIILVYLYAEGMLALGWSLLPRVGLVQISRPATLLVAGLLGVVAWSLVIWTASALGIGSPAAVRLIALAVLGLGILFGRNPRLGVVLARAIDEKRRLPRLFVALIVAFLLALFAKAAVVIDHDSLWYGLQAEEVLVGEGSLYAPQGLVSVAHYYPKLYEALQLPFAGLGSVSLIFGVGIFSLLMIVLTASALLREFKVKQDVRVWAAALIATLPAVANIAVTAKGDAFSAWLMMVAVLGLVRFRKGFGAVWFWVALSSLSLGVLARLSNLPYAAILLVILLASIGRESSFRKSVSALIGPGVSLGCAAALLGVLVLARSVILDGVPLIAPTSLVMLQQDLGLTLKYPVGLLPSEEGSVRLPVADGLWGVLFDPAGFPHLIITWIGNVWAFLPISALLLARERLRPVRGTWPLLLLGASFFLVLFLYKQPVLGGDGNYFIFPLMCLTMWGMTLVSRLDGLSIRYFGWVLLVFSISAGAISFVTGSWGPGTRAWDLSMNRLPFEYESQERRAIAAANLEGVARYFETMPPGTRVVGLEPGKKGQSESAGWWLPVQYQAVEAFVWQQPALVHSTESFQSYLRLAEIEYVVVPRQVSGGSVATVVKSALGALQSDGLANISYQDEHFSIWKLRVVYRTTTPLDGGGTAQVDAALEQICADSENVVAAVSWSTQWPTIAIEVQSDKGIHPSLWAEEGGAGRLATGPWVSKGTEFTFRRGRAGEVLGRLKVVPVCH